ncbi:MAG: SDR family oxidoreductase [Alphaproteobacteria bacterium]
MPSSHPSNAPAEAARRKVAIVTGGAWGIGRAIAARLVSDGWAALLVDKDADAAAEAAASLGASFVAGDVGSEPDVERAVATAVERFGGLDAVVSNAGINIRRPVGELSLADWLSVLNTNLTATFLFAKHAGKALAQTGGSIVAIASTRAHMSEPGTEAYAASKGGLVALTHALAISLGPAVRVNCISPGWIASSGSPRKPAPVLSEADHAQHPAGRVGRPEDIAGLVAWLVGPEAGFVTGAEFVVDGGMTRKMIYV